MILKLFSVEKMNLYVYKVNVLIDGERQIFLKFIIYYFQGTLFFFSSETHKKICLMVRKEPCLPPLLKSGHSQMTLELKPRMGNFSPLN